MGFYEWLFIAAVAVLFVVPPIFVWHRVYDDGVFGRLGLAGISFCSFVILAEATLGRQVYHTSGEVAGLVAAFAVFLVWHLVRFHMRVVLKRPMRPSSGKQPIPRELQR